MRRVAYLASKATLPGSPTRRDDAFEHDLMMTALHPAFSDMGMTIEEIDWDDPKRNWAEFDAAIIGTTWDYWDRPDIFLQSLKDIEQSTRLFNSASTVQWNSSKTYLKELETKGAKLIPTLWVDQVDQSAFASCFEALNSSDLVFKRQIGAGADGQYRLSPDDALPDFRHPMMIQPFMSAIQDEGEISFVFIDGSFSHAVLKRAKPGDYRIQSSYGGYESEFTPQPADLSSAQKILGMLNEPPLYARVDMLRDEDGHLMLMELELIEPYLYPEQGPQLGERLARAVAGRLSS